jgi:hypothetical protein
MPLLPQADFASALRDPSHAAPAPAARFGIYRNNRLAALTESLAATYPATERLVGPKFFRTMAAAFVARHPPRSPVLLEYGGELPDFIDAFAPAAGLPYLGGVARVEWAWMRAYHARDAVARGADVLAPFAGDEADLTFVLHPSFALVRSAYPAGTIWQMNTGEGTPRTIESWQGESVLVARPAREVYVRIVPEDTATFLIGLDTGQTLGVAVQAARTANPDFDLAAQLAGAFALGLIADASLPQENKTS